MDRRGLGGLLLSSAGAALALAAEARHRLGTHLPRHDAAIVAGVFLIAAGVVLIALGPGPTLVRRLTPARLLPVLIALAVYGGFCGVTINRFPPRGDEPHYMLEAYSLALDHDRNLARDYTDPARIAPMFGAIVPSVHTFNYTHDPSVAISVHSVGVPALLAPAAALSDDPRLMRVEMLLVATAAAYLLLSILRRLVGGGLLVYLGWAAVVFSAPMLLYSTAIYPEVPGAFLLLLSLRLAIARNLSWTTIAFAGTAAALMPWLHVRFTYLSAAVAGLLLARAGPMPPVPRDLRARARRTLLVLLPFVVSGGLLAVANQHWYGSPLLTAAYAPTHGRLDASWAYVHSIGGIFQPTYGWLPYAPLHVLAFVGLVYFAIRGRGWALIGGAVGVLYLLLVASSTLVEVGTAFPGRFEVVLLPLAALPLVLLLREVRWMRLVALPLALLTLALSILSGVRIGALLGPTRLNGTTLPLASELAAAWPHMARHRGDPPYPDWPKLLAWMCAIGLLGCAPVVAERWRARRMPSRCA